MNGNEILFFLTYGYFPNYNVKIIPQKITKLDIDNYSYIKLQEKFYNIFTTVIKEMIDSIPENKLLIIPISGGLDSRAILAGTLEYVNPSRIRTYTFGIKGSYDFEIGKMVAKKAGVNHEAIELNSLRLTQAEMVEIAKRCDFQTHLFHHPPLNILEKLIDNNVVLSGYLGDLVFGSYADKAKIEFKDASNWYLKNKQYSNYLKNNDYSTFLKYLYPIDKNLNMSPVEQLILYERGPKLTAPHVLMKGWKYKTPLIDKRILDFMFSVPNTYRVNEKLFIDTMIKYYPDLFNIRAKTTFGYHLKSPKALQYIERLKNKIILKLNTYAGFNLIYPPLNYIDFNKEIIRRPDLVEIFKTNLQDLENRNILDDIKPTMIYNLHLKKKNLSSILILLTSLELILKAKEQ